MNNFDVGHWVAEQALSLPQAHIIEGVPFDLLSLELDDIFFQKVTSCVSYDEMVMMAADNGLAYYDVNDDACRVVDNKRLAKKVSALWRMDELELDSEPCMKERVGVIVCEISGLSELLEERKLEDEIRAEEENFIDGDNLPGNPELGNLAQANLERDAINNAA